MYRSCSPTYDKGEGLCKRSWPKASMAPTSPCYSPQCLEQGRAWHQISQVWPVQNYCGTPWSGLEGCFLPTWYGFVWSPEVGFVDVRKGRFKQNWKEKLGLALWSSEASRTDNCSLATCPVAILTIWNPCLFEGSRIGSCGWVPVNSSGWKQHVNACGCSMWSRCSIDCPYIMVTVFSDVLGSDFWYLNIPFVGGARNNDSEWQHFLVKVWSSTNGVFCSSRRWLVF